MWGAIAGTILGGMIDSKFKEHNNAVTGAQNLQFSKDLFKYQNENKYQFMVDDLVKAGLNPMLAVGNLNATASGTVSGDSSTDTQGVNNAYAAKKQQEILEQQTEIERQKAVSERLEKEANAKMAEALANRYNTLTPTENAKTVAETQFINQNIAESSARIDKIYSDIKNDSRVSDATITKLIEDAKHLRVVTGNESIKYDLLIRARDSKSEALKREYLNTWYGELQHQIGYGNELLGIKPSGFSYSPKYGTGSVRW